MASLHLRVCQLALVVPALTFPVVQACGSSHAAGPGRADGSTPTDSGGGVTSDAAIPGPGTATLTGPQSFDVGSAQMETSSQGGCGSGNGGAGVIAQLAILLTSKNLPSLLCMDAGEPDASAGEWLDIELATNQAIAGAAQLTDSLTPGTYVIGNEGEDDPDICMLPSGSNAFIQLLTPTGYDAQATAISGTVIIDSISAGAVTGTFSVLMGGPYGTTDADPPPSLSGAFNATACP
jgi:hypothetical protein